MFRAYYYLVKPGIIRGNIITAGAGFFLASKGDIDWGLLAATLGGLSLVIASACAFNNYLDRDIDAKMARTRKRALVIGSISEKNALIFATVIGLAGSTILGVFTSQLAQLVALLGLFFYVVVYGYAKRRTVWGTAIGSISGATPPVVGYTAVAGRLDWPAVILFIILVFWQMPHFYSIAIFNMKQYASAKIPVLPIKKGVRAAKFQIAAYVTAFMAAAASLSVFGYTGYLYLSAVAVFGLFWLRLCILGFQAKDDSAWAKNIFRFSLLVLTILSLTISLDSWLP